MATEVGMSRPLRFSRGGDGMPREMGISEAYIQERSGDPIRYKALPMTCSVEYSWLSDPSSVLMVVRMCQWV